MVGERQWVAGGELGSTDKSAPNLKQIILNILEDGETVTKYVSQLSCLDHLDPLLDKVSLVSCMVQGSQKT